MIDFQIASKYQNLRQKTICLKTNIDGSETAQGFMINNIQGTTETECDARFDIAAVRQVAEEANGSVQTRADGHACNDRPRLSNPTHH
jgi:hypothetical protein